MLSNEASSRWSRRSESMSARVRSLRVRCSPASSTAGQSYIRSPSASISWPRRSWPPQSAASRGEAGVPWRRDGEAVEPELRDVLAEDVDAPNRLCRTLERCLGAVRDLVDEGWVDRVAQHVLAVDGLHLP